MEKKRTTLSTRMSAQERREHIVKVALPIFGIYGLHGASTLLIAEQAGISETYIFRLFGTKKELFLAVIEYVHERIMLIYRTFFASTVDHSPENLQTTMKQTISLEERLLWLQAYAACQDEEIQRVLQEKFREMYVYVLQKLEKQEEVQAFFASNMLAMILMALGIADITLLAQ
ncbi:MAG TPA: TetR/AcrR family transcriptional regulator [Ktedonobacteraceae bacterium]|jgi:AcrR family transcriptional regulator|nr:TetR/AcrR family transcriptional regulator [Ktedonobacteraceae bacterium]